MDTKNNKDDLADILIDRYWTQRVLEIASDAQRFFADVGPSLCVSATGSGKLGTDGKAKEHHGKMMVAQVLVLAGEFPDELMKPLLAAIDALKNLPCKPCEREHRSVNVFPRGKADN